MAPATSPGRKRRENQFFEPGVQGRKTGITLPENARDEHGIENLDGIFSSPEKSPAKRAVRNGNTTITSSEEMELAQSSVPEPTEVLSTRRVFNSSKTVFPPPMGRSPFKTNIGSSPRRQSSVAPMSQMRQTSDPVERAASHPAVYRRLDFLADDAEAGAVQTSTRNGAGRPVRPVRRSIYDLDRSPVHRQKRTYDEGITEQEEVSEGEGAHDLANGFRESSPLPVIADDSLQLVEEGNDSGLGAMDEGSELPQISSPSNLRKSRVTKRGPESVDSQLDFTEKAPVVPKSRPGRRSSTRNSLIDGIVKGKPAERKAPTKRGSKPKGKLLVANSVPPIEESVISEGQSESEVIAEVPQPEPVVRRKRGRPKKDSEISVDSRDATALDPTIADHSVIQPSRKRGRKPKNNLSVHQDATELEEESPRAPKRAKNSGKAPVQRDPNVQMAPPVFKKPAIPATKVVQASPSKRSVSPSIWARSRAVSRLREGTPLDEATSRQTRSGRQVIKPLDWWMGEKAEYGRDRSIRGVTYAEEVTLPSLKRTTRGGRRRAQSRARPLDSMGIIDEEEEYDDLEDWELRCETVTALVSRWDPILGSAGDEEYEQDIAYGSNSASFKSAAGAAKFSLAKLTSGDFFGTGIIEIPAGGFKLTKNSRRMSMAFFVHTGKVDVKVADTEFTISRGGVWHVPRGNSYSINNNTQKTARIFFAQGCEVLVENAEVEE